MISKVAWIRARARARIRRLLFIVLSASMVVRNVSKLRPRTVETFAISLGREHFLSLSLSLSLSLARPGFHLARDFARAASCVGKTRPTDFRSDFHRDARREMSRREKSADVSKAIML